MTSNGVKRMQVHCTPRSVIAKSHEAITQLTELLFSQSVLFCSDLDLVHFQTPGLAGSENGRTRTVHVNVSKCTPVSSESRVLDEGVNEVTPTQGFTPSRSGK